MAIHLTTKWFEVDATGGAVELFLSDILELDSGATSYGFYHEGATGLLTVNVKDVEASVSAVGHPILKSNKDDVGSEVTDAIIITDATTPSSSGMDIYYTGAAIVDLRLQVASGKAKFKIHLSSKTR